MKLSKAVEDEVQELCDEAFQKGYQAGQLATEFDTGHAESADDIQGEVECELMFDLKSDVELDDDACTKIRYKAAMMAAVKFGLEQDLAPEEMLEDLEMTYDDMVGE